VGHVGNKRKLQKIMGDRKKRNKGNKRGGRRHWETEKETMGNNGNVGDMSLKKETMGDKQETQVNFHSKGDTG
jgi:hypothetical protein